MRAYLVDPAVKAIEQIDLPSDEDIPQLLSYTNEEVLMQPVDVSKHDTMFVDEEGFLKDGLRVFKLRGVTAHSFAGKAVFVGTDGEDGEVTNCELSLSQLTNVIEWTDLVSTGKFGSAPPSFEAHGTVFISGGPPLMKVEPYP